jgi:hypothetical protein
MDIITKKEAYARGLKRYFTGKPCMRGHISERSLGGTCIECRPYMPSVGRKHAPQTTPKRQQKSVDARLDRCKEFLERIARSPDYSDITRRQAESAAWQISQIIRVL